MQQDRHKREGSTTQHKRTHTALDTRERQILTLSLEFPNNYSQKCVLWRNMTPPDRHGSPPKIMMTKNLWPSKWEEQAGPPKRLPSSSSGWWQPKPKGLPVFFVTSQSSSHENLPPLVSVFFFFFLPRPPRVSLISTPTRPRLSASQQTLPCAPRRCEAGKKGVGKPQFHQHFTVAPRKRCARLWRRVRVDAVRAGVRVGVYCCGGGLVGGGTDGVRGQWLREAGGAGRGAAPTQRGGRAHMDA